MDKLIKINDSDIIEKETNKRAHGWEGDMMDIWDYDYRPPDYHTKEELYIFYPKEDKVK
jgi:hypothetical protein